MTCKVAGLVALAGSCTLALAADGLSGLAAEGLVGDTWNKVSIIHKTKTSIVQVLWDQA